MDPSKDPFRDFESLSILIIGDVMVDRYLNGRVDRISPEAPVPVVAFQSEDNRLGGAANVALNIRALGARPLLCSIIGKDDNAGLFLREMKNQELDPRGIVLSGDRCTTVKTRVMAGGQQLLRVDREDTHSLLGEDLEDLKENLLAFLDHESIDLILFQDYNKGVLSEEVISHVCEEAARRKIPTAVDPKFSNFFAYRNTTLFKPNLKEVRAQLELSSRPDLAELKNAAAAIRQKLENRFTMITLGERGLFFDGDGESDIIPTQPRSIADVCGAGDTVISMAALGLALGLKMREIATLANLAGGQVCERVGVVPVDREQLEREYFNIQSQFAKTGD